MNVLLGRKEAAFTNITFLFDKYIEPNTMYYEGKGYPCGETPPVTRFHQKMLNPQTLLPRSCHRRGHQGRVLRCDGAPYDTVGGFSAAI
jgi:hypothetical protein